MAAKIPQNLRGCALEQPCEKGLMLKMPDWGPRSPLENKPPMRCLDPIEGPHTLM